MRATRAVVAGCVLLIALSPVPAAAQEASAEPSEEQLEEARSLYYEGLSLIDHRQWAGAATRLERVLEIRDSIVASYQLAVAYSHLGRPLEAAERLRRVLDDPEVVAEMETASRKLLAEVEAATGSLTLRLRGNREGVHVRVGERAIPARELDAPVPVDPGQVRVVAERNGEVVAESTVDVGGAAGLHPEVELRLSIREPTLAPSRQLTAAPVAPLASGDATGGGTAPRDDGEGGGIFGQWWFWTAVAVVAAGAAVTVVALGAESDPADPSAARGDLQPGFLEGRVDAP